MVTRRKKIALLRFKQRSTARQMRTLMRTFDSLLRSFLKEILKSVPMQKAKENPKLKLGKIDYKKFENKFKTAIDSAAKKFYASNLADGGAIDLDIPDVPGFELEVSGQSKDRLTSSYIRDSKQQFKGQAKGMADNIRNFVADQVERGVASDTFVRNITTKFANLSTGKAEVIARNLTFQAHEKSRSDFWEEMPDDSQPTGKDWLPTEGGDGDRFWHNEIPSRGPVDLDGDFLITGGPDGSFEAPYPNAAVLPASEAANCGCTTAYTFGRKGK